MASRSMIGPPSAQSTRNTPIRFRSWPIAMCFLPPWATVAIQMGAVYGARPPLAGCGCGLLPSPCEPVRARDKQRCAIEIPSGDRDATEIAIAHDRLPSFLPEGTR